jgi:hypothetical protein
MPLASGRLLSMVLDGMPTGGCIFFGVTTELFFWDYFSLHQLKKNTVIQIGIIELS